MAKTSTNKPSESALRHAEPVQRNSILPQRQAEPVQRSSVVPQHQAKVIKPNQLKKSKYSSAPMKDIARGMTKRKAKSKRAESLARLGRTEFFEHVKKVNRTPEQEQTRMVVKLWSDLPNELIRQDYFPRKVDRVRNGQDITAAIEDSDKWDIKVLKSLSSFAKKLDVYCDPEEDVIMGVFCVGYLERAIDERRKKEGISKNSLEWGVTCRDVGMAYIRLCEDHEIEAQQL